MDVYWLERSAADVPAGDGWLSPHELARLAGLRFEKRRADWRLGRWTAKAAAASYLGIPCGNIEVRVEPSGAPMVWAGGRPAPVTVSLSHRERHALCAVAEAHAELGCDLEIAEARSDAFVADYFTQAERSFIDWAPAHSRPQRVALLWSAKESALKALRIGLRMDTRDVEVSIGDTTADSWRPLRISCGERRLDGWWKAAGRFVRTVVASPAPNSPRTIG